MKAERNVISPKTIIDKRFQVERMLGSGGYGEVYEAQQLSMQRKVALKVLRPHLAGDTKVITRFQNEARFACQLTHPNTVIYFDFGFDEAQQVLYLAMEYLEGESLAQRLKRSGAMSVEETTLIIEQICGSLHEAHQHGLIHRDIKPGNIMLIQRAGRMDFVKVIDFGIAKATDKHAAGGQNLTGTSILGTPHYMAPEQIRGGIELDARTDIYALGCLAYKMLSGLTPFRGQTAIEIATQHLTSAPPPIGSLTQLELPVGLSAFLKRTLSKDRDKRPETAQAFYEQWCEALSKEPPTQPLQKKDAPKPKPRFEPPPPEPTLAPDSLPTPSPTSADSLGEGRRRKLLMAIGVTGLMAVIAVGLLAGKFLARQQRDTQPFAAAPNTADAGQGAAAAPNAPDAAAATQQPPTPPPEVDCTIDDSLPCGDGANGAKDGVANTGQGTGERVDLDEDPSLLKDSPPSTPDDAKERRARWAAIQKARKEAQDKGTKPAGDKPSAPADTTPIKEASAPVKPKAASKAAVSVRVVAAPWGNISISGQTKKSPANFSLKPGRYSVTLTQGDRARMSRSINVSNDGKKVFMFTFPPQK